MMSKQTTWIPKDRRMASITRLSKDELFRCLTYLDDHELRKVTSTCVWFREAYFAHVKSGSNDIIELASKKRDNRFPSLKELWVNGLKNVEKLSKIDLAYQLPKLCSFRLTGVECDLSDIPKFECVTQFICNDCVLGLWNSYDSEDIFDGNFPNLKKLELYNSDIQSSKFVSKQLEALAIYRHSSISEHQVLPKLKEFKVFMADFPEGGLLFSNGLKKVEVVYPNGGYAISPKPYLTHLFIVSRYIPEWVLPGLTRLFPHLKDLHLGTDNSNWQIDLRNMSSHPTLEKLSIMSDIEQYHDVFGLENLSPNNFPCLSKIATTARYLDLNIMTPNPNLKKLEVGNCANINYQQPLEDKFPNLEIVRWDMCNDGDIPYDSE